MVPSFRSCTMLAGISLVHALCAQTETEPNQGISDATVNAAWTHGTTYTGSIAMNPPPLDYFDFFRIVLPEDATVYMEVLASSPAAANVPVTIYEENGTALSFMGSGFAAGSTPVTTVMEFACLQAGTYFFQLTPNQGADISYAITWSYQGALFGNDQEPNADGAQAQANGLMQQGIWREGHHSYNIAESLTDVVDVHALHIAEDGALSVTVIASHIYGPGASLQVLLFDSSGTQMTGMFAVVGDAGSTDTTTMESLCLKDGTYFLVMYGVNTCGASYRIRYDHTPAPWADDADVVTALVPGDWVQGHLSFNANGGEPASDQYTLVVPAHQYVRIELIAADMQGGGATTDLRLLDSTGTTVASWSGDSGPINDPDTNIHRQGCLAPGTYTIWLQHINACGVCYRIRCAVEPPVYGDEPEPNNTLASAIIASPDTDNGGFLETGDQDHWRFYKQYSGALVVDLRASTQTPTPGTFLCTIYNVNGDLLDQVSLTTGVENQSAPYTPFTFNVTVQDTLILRASAQNVSCLSYDLRYAGGIAGVEDVLPSMDHLIVRPLEGGSGVYMIASTEPITTISVLDMGGAEVRFERGNARQVRVDLAAMPSGIYACHVRLADGRMQAVRLAHLR